MLDGLYMQLFPQSTKFVVYSQSVRMYGVFCQLWQLTYQFEYHGYFDMINELHDFISTIQEKKVIRYE